MKQVKLKSADNGSDSVVLTDQLMAVLKEISAFSSRMEEMEQRELIHDFAPAFSYEQRLRDLRAKLLPGKEPAKPVIFLTRMVIECLDKGPMSEKEIKIIVLDRCKALGIKSSNRGLIAGTGMDVATVCSVLHALGAVEPVDASNHPVGASSVKLEADEGSTAAEAAGCPEQLTGPASDLYALLSTRWRERLGEYIADAQKSKAEAESAAAVSEAASVPVPSSSGNGTSAPICLSGGDATSAKSSAGGIVASSGPSSASATKTTHPLPAIVAAAVPSTQTTSAANIASNSSVPTNANHSNSSTNAKVNASANTGDTAAAPAAGHFLVAAPPQSKHGAPSAPAHVAEVPPSSSSQTKSLSLSDSQGTANTSTSAMSTVHTLCVAAAAKDTEATPASPTAAHPSTDPAVPANSVVPQSLPATTIGGLGLRPVSSGSISGTSGPTFLSSTGKPVGIAQLPVSSAAATTGYFAPPNSFLSASAESQKQQLPSPAPPLAVPTTAVQENSSGASTYTSVLSASGTPITISAPGPSGDTAASSSKAGKTKTPKAPRPPSEKKPPKKPSKPTTDAAGTPATAPAAGLTQTAAGAGSGSTNSNKARRGPSALRIWRLREEFVPYAAQLTNAAMGSAGSSSSEAAQVNTPGAGGSALSSSSSKSSTAVPVCTEGRHVFHNNSSNSNATTSSSGNSSNLAMQLLLQPRMVNTAAQADFTLQRALEVEEKLLRRLAGQCGITLKPARFRVGTTYLSADPEIMAETFRSRFVQNSAQFPAFCNKTSAKLSNSSETNSEDLYRDGGVGESAEPKYTLYDDSVRITSAYLLDKVRRTKRQRGDCLYGSITLPNSSSTSASVSAARNAAAASVGVFSAQHVHSLSAVCAKSQDYFWAASAAATTKNNPTKKKSSVSQSKVSNEAITMGEYAYNLNMGITNPSGVAPVVLSSCSNGSSITSYTLRRYALSLHLVDAQMPMLDPAQATTMFAAAPSSSSSGKARPSTASPGSREVLRIPDLSLHTREIAWAEIAQEFTVLAAPVDEPGALPSSSSTLTLQDAANSDAASTASAMKSKKRKHLQSQGKTASSATLEDATQKLASIEVLAPQYREVTPVSEIVRKMQQQTGDNINETNGCTNASESGEGSDSAEEDTSDEAFERRHEAVLQAMRDKWSLLQQLKSEAMYGPGGAPTALGTNSSTGGAGYRSGGYGYYGGHSAAGPTSTGADAGTSPASAGGIPVSAVLSVPVTGTPNGGRFQNLSPRKRGLASAHLKRRGRPPKIAKYTGVAHASAAAVPDTQAPPAVGIAAAAAGSGGDTSHH